MKKMTVAMLVLAAGLLAGSAPAAMTHTAATIDTRADVLKEWLPEDTPVVLETDDGQLVIVLSDNITAGISLPADLGPVTIDLNGWAIKGPDGADGTTKTSGENGGAAITVTGESGADAGTTTITVKDQRCCDGQFWKDGPIFAACNVGATEPQQSGYYFWWGDTVGYTHDGSKWVSVADGTTSIEFTVVNPANSAYDQNVAALQSAGYIDDASNPFLNAAHDAATVHLGAPWRMPTEGEINSLCANCDKELTTQGGVQGFLLKGTGDYASSTIFLPLTGYGSSKNLDDGDKRVAFWSSTPVEDSPKWAKYFTIDVSGANPATGSRSRFHGVTVRPVKDSAGIRPAAGTGRAEIIGGDGGDGNPAGKGALPIVDAEGNPLEVTLEIEPESVRSGIDGKNLREELIKETFGEPEWVVTGPDEQGWYTAILTEDLTGPVEIPDDLGKVKIDLNDWNITCANGVNGTETTAGTDGGNGLVIVHGDPQRCDPSNYWLINEADAEDTSRPAPGTDTHGTAGDGVVAGGNGGDGNTPGDGAAGLMVAEGATPAAVTVGNDEGSGNTVTVRGGNGGNGLGTDEDGNGIDGGNGGAGVDGDVTKNDGDIIGGNGGNGGNGGETGGNGGNGGDGVTGSAGVGSGNTTGGNGGDGGVGDKSGGNGGNGGNGDTPGENGKNGETRGGGSFVEDGSVVICAVDPAADDKWAVTFSLTLKDYAPAFGSWVESTATAGKFKLAVAGTPEELATATPVAVSNVRSKEPGRVTFDCGVESARLNYFKVVIEE